MDMINFHSTYISEQLDSSSFDVSYIYIYINQCAYTGPVSTNTLFSNWTLHFIFQYAKLSLDYGQILTITYHN